MTDWQWPNSYIERVVDGDTFIAELTRDLGFNGSVNFHQRLRLNRINCPPVKTDDGKKAKEFVQEHATHPVDITTVGAYKYGDEWMAEVQIFQIGNLSDALVEAGLAVYWDGHGPRPLGKKK